MNYDNICEMHKKFKGLQFYIFTLLQLTSDYNQLTELIKIYSYSWYVSSYSIMDHIEKL